MTGSAVEQIRSRVSASRLHCSSALPPSPAGWRRTSEQCGSRCCVSAVSAPSLSPPGYALPSPPNRISPFSHPWRSRQPDEPVGTASVQDPRIRTAHMSASDLADEYNAVMADVIAVAGELWRTLAWRSTCELQNR